MNSNGNGLIRVATYARVSTQEQVLGTSLEFQDSQFIAYCQLQGWTIVNSYVDPGFSGKDDNRPGLQRLLSDAKIGLFDRVVVHKLDRMARNLHLLLEIEVKLRDRHVSLTSIKESIDTNSGTGKMVFQMFGMIAEWERESIRERTMSGRLQRFKDGCWAGGKAPYGYAYNKDTKKLVINETEARVVRRIFNDYDSGKTLNAMANTLNYEKVIPRGKNSKGWRQTAVRQVLLNPTYKGIQIVNRHSHISDINKVDLSKAIQITVPAIVSDQIWHIAQERLKNNKHIKPKKQGEFLLQGIITCGRCGYAYHAVRMKGVRYYVCRGKMKSKHIDGSPRCKAPSFKAEWLEKEAWRRIEELINDPNKVIEVLTDTIDNLRLREAELNARIRPIDERLIEVAEQKAKLDDDWVVRHMNNDKFKELKGNLDKEEIRLRALRAGIDPAQIAELESTKGILRFWESQVRSMAWNTENEDGSMFRLVDEPHQVALRVVGLEDREISKTLGFPASKRELLDKLQVKLMVFDDRIEINGLFPVEPINIQLCTSTRGQGG